MQSVLILIYKYVCTGEKAKVGLSKTKMVKKAEAGQIGSKLVKTGQSFCKTESKWVKAGQNLNNLAQAV